MGLTAITFAPALLILAGTDELGVMTVLPTQLCLLWFTCNTATQPLTKETEGHMLQLLAYLITPLSIHTLKLE